MKRTILLLTITIGLAFNSCETAKKTNNTQRGAGIGAVAGGVIGGILGNNLGKGGKGALGAIIGAAVGGAAGGLIGNKMDKQAKEIETTMPGAEVVRTEEGIQVILDEKSDIRFEYNKSELTPKSKTNLEGIVEIFKNYPDTNITVYGHTDSKGSDEYNLTLSNKRAQSVVNFLTQSGIDASRLNPIGMGEENPRADNETDAGRAANRRVEFAITANEKMIEDAKKEAGEI